MKIRVLMFCSQFRPLIGGAERQAEKLAVTLVGQGATVCILTPRLESESPVLENCGGVEVYRFPFVDLCTAVPWARGLGPVNLALIRQQVRRAMGRLIGRTDVVHAHVASPMAAFVLEVCRLRKVPMLCKVAMAGDRTDLKEVARIGLGGPFLAKSMVRRMDHWVATTDGVRASLIDLGVAPERIANIPNGVSLPLQPTGVRDAMCARRFLYLGRLSSNIERDVRTLVLAFEELADSIPDVELAVVGGGDLYADTQQMVARSRHAARILVPGQQPPERWLAWADCFVLPSVREGLSNALLEAMASGLPCIANDIPSNRETLDGGAAGLLVPVGNVSGLVAAMLAIGTTPRMAERLGLLARQRVTDTYLIESVAARYMDLYARLIRGAASRQGGEQDL